MAKPTNREEFIQFCLRRLGHPFHEVEVSEEQLSDLVDIAIDKFHQYHSSGSDRSYYRHVIDQTDITNNYITIPENIIGVVRLFEFNTFIGSSLDLLQPQFQFILGTLPMFGSGTYSIVPYYVAMTHLSLLQEILVPSSLIQFNRHRNRVYMEGAMARLQPGQYVIVECFEVLDPTLFADIWFETWLIEYTTQLIKQQWGTNLKKFDGVPLLGGVKVNGQKLYDEATERLEQLDRELIDKYSYPPMDLLY